MRLPRRDRHLHRSADGTIAARKATTVDVVATFNGTLYVATVTIQSANPDNPSYARDEKTIMTGFQMLPPGAS